MDKQKWFERRHREAKEHDEDPPTEEEWKLYLAEMKDWRLPVEDLKKRFWTEEVQELIDSYSPEAFQELYFRKLASKRKIQNIQKKQKEKLAQFILKTPEKKESAFSDTFRKVCYGVGKEGKHFTTKEAFNPPEDDLIYIFHSPERKEADCLSRADLYRNFLRNEVREWTGQKRRLVSIPNDKLPPMWVLWIDEFKDARYFAFELQKPKMMQIGSTFGVSSLHGAKELVYRATPIDSNDSSIADLAAIPRRKDTEYLKEIKVQKQRYWDVIVLAEQISSFIEQNNSEPPDLDDFIEDLVHNDELEGALRESLPQMSKMLVLASRFISERAKRILLLNQLEMIFEEESEIYFQEEIDIYNALYVENFDNDKIKNRANPGIVVKFNPNVDLFYFRGAENVYNAIFQEENISEMRLDVSREEFLHVAKHCALPKMNIWYEILPTMTFEEMKSMNKLYHQRFPNDISQTHYYVITPPHALLEFSSPYYVNKLAPYLDNFDDSKDSGLNMFLIKDKVLNKLGKNGLKLVLRGCFSRSHFLKRYERRFLDKLITKINDSDFEAALEPFFYRFVYYKFSTEVLYYLSLKKPKSSALKKLMSKYGQPSMSYLHNRKRNEALKKFVLKNPEFIEGGGMDTLLYLNNCLGPEPQTIVDKNREKILLDFLNR